MQSAPPADGSVFEAVFSPKSVAVVGASQDPTKLGTGAMTALQAAGYLGRIYPVHPRLTELYGLTCYPSLRDIPEPVDRVVVSVPAASVPGVIADCVANGARVAQILTDGFGEAGAAGTALQHDLVAEARKGGLRLIGPNCVGTYSAEGRLAFTRTQSFEPGEIAIASQSGGLCFDLLLGGQSLGLRFRHVISVGNCADLDLSDFLTHFAADPKVSAIGLYVESVPDGLRFLQVLAETARRKPVLILKGGRSGRGAQSVTSHTGNLAGTYDLWQAVFRQAGAIEVRSIDEMLAGMVGLQFFPPDQPAPRGDTSTGLALVGNGGGATVVACDRAEELGLTFAHPSAATRELLGGLDVHAGSGPGNAVDFPAGRLLANFGEVMRAYCADPAVRTVIFHFNLLSFGGRQDPLPPLMDMITQLDGVDRAGTTLIAVLRTQGNPAVDEVRLELTTTLHRKGIAVYSSIEDAMLGLRVTNEAVSG